MMIGAIKNAIAVRSYFWSIKLPFVARSVEGLAMTQRKSLVRLIWKWLSPPP